MKITDIEYTLTVKDALNKIKMNRSQSFIWFPVKNKTGAIFELGGTHESLKMYIPHYENGLPMKYQFNEMVHQNYAISCGNTWEQPNDGINLDEPKFIKYATNKDFREATFIPGSYREVVVIEDKPARLNFVTKKS